MSGQPQPKRGVLWLAAVMVASILACILYLGYGLMVGPIVRHRQVADRMNATVLRLAVNRPPDLTDDQWAYCVTWTWNLHCEYGLVRSYVPTRDLARIEQELQKRIDRGVDLATIDWIWDQYIQSYPLARHYNKWRPTAPHNAAEFEAGAHHGNPLSQWRADYKRKVAELDHDR